MKYALMRTALGTVGRLSDGIRLGWETGFNSGLMLEYVYENKPRGITPIGQWLDSQYLAHPVWEAIRDRRRILIAQLNTAIDHYRTPMVFDLAAGMGSYLFALDEGRARIIAGDFDERNIKAGKQKTLALKRQDIVFLKSNAFIYDELAVPHADILISSGFFDILVEEAQIRAVLENGSRITRSGARWVFTIEEDHTDVNVLEETLVTYDGTPWKLVLRPAERLIELAKPYGWELETLERNKFFAIGTLIRQ